MRNRRRLPFTSTLGVLVFVFFASSADARNHTANPTILNLKISQNDNYLMRKKLGENLVAPVRTLVEFDIHNKKGELPVEKFFPKYHSHPRHLWNCNLESKPFLTCEADLEVLNGSAPSDRDKIVQDYIELFLSSALMTKMFPVERINKENAGPVDSNIPGIRFILRFRSRQIGEVTCERFRMNVHYKLEFTCK